jgi:hypothetical protein
VRRSEKKRRVDRDTRPAEDGRAAAEARAEKDRTPAVFLVGGGMILAAAGGCAGFEVHASWVGVLGGVAVVLAFVVWRLGSGDSFL